MLPCGIHDTYDLLLDSLVSKAGVSRDVLASVLVRSMVVSPNDFVRADIAKGDMLSRPSPLNAGAVSKAVKALIEEGLLTQDPSRADYDQRAGRPIKPLRLGSDKWGLMGIKVIHKDNRPTALTGIITKLRMDLSDVLVWEEMDLPTDATFKNLDFHVAAFAHKLLRRLAEVDGFTTRKILGLGVEIGGHVKDGYVFGATHVGLNPHEHEDLLTPLLGNLNVPIVLDNDVNVLAIRELYRREYKERDIAVVAVFEDGVGASLILDGHVYRGGGGMAAEPGHLPVRHSEESRKFVKDRKALPGMKPGFQAACHCGEFDHIDCYAVPARLDAELGADIQETAASQALDDKGKLTLAGQAFTLSGRALGQGLAAIINIVNPARMLVILPEALVSSARYDGSSAAAYLSSMESTVTAESFSTGARDARASGESLTIESLNSDEIGFIGAHCAALRAFDAFIAHARGRDECSSSLALQEKTFAA